MPRILVYLVCWLGMVIIGILNGLLREYTYGRALGEPTAHQLSSVIAIFLFGLYIWVLTGLSRPESGRQALIIGGMWLMMTVAFEFLFGHYVAGHSWSHLLQDYHLLKGRVWPLVLICVTLAPYLFTKFRRVSN